MLRSRPDSHLSSLNFQPNSAPLLRILTSLTSYKRIQLSFASRLFNFLNRRRSTTMFPNITQQLLILRCTLRPINIGRQKMTPLPFLRSHTMVALPRHRLLLIGLNWLPRLPLRNHRVFHLRLCVLSSNAQSQSVCPCLLTLILLYLSRGLQVLFLFHHCRRISQIYYPEEWQWAYINYRAQTIFCWWIGLKTPLPISRSYHGQSVHIRCPTTNPQIRRKRRNTVCSKINPIIDIHHHHSTDAQGGRTFSPLGLFSVLSFI